MSVDVKAITGTIFDAAKVAFGDEWDVVQVYAPAEFKKMAVQLADIAENVALYKLNPSQGYSEETGKILFKMQRTAAEGVLVALTKLTLVAVQKVMDAIVDALKNAFKGIFSFL
jgi:hypothetical protein